MRVRIASAGTGKTTGLVRRYLEEVQDGRPLRRLAGVTFTRNAAEELRVRVGEGVEALLREGRFLDLVALRPEARPRLEEASLELDGATLTTIHGFMLRTLRLCAPLVGIDPDVTPFGEWEARGMLQEELAALRYLHVGGGAPHGSDAVREAFGRLGEVAEARVLEAFEARSLAPELVAADGDAGAAAVTTLLSAAYGRFEARLGGSRLAPGEIERRALALTRVPDALERLVRRYPRVFVDEFQDVNPAQGRFFEALEAGGAAVEVVGDPKQSIYGFRHADVEVFRRALRRGEALPPLVHTRRHARLLARFLNALTAACAERGWGYRPEEAPPVRPVGPQGRVGGRVELHWVSGAEPLAKLRRHEAEVLSERLRAAHETLGVAYADMAVLARSHASLAHVESALVRAGVPAVLRQARGYYERIEVRDLVHALRVGVEPAGSDLAAWLRSPFAEVPLAEVDALLHEADPVAALEERHPVVAQRLARIRTQVRGAPLAALKFLIRAPFLDGRRYVDALTRRQRENVDALLFRVAADPPAELAVLLDRLERLSEQEDAGDVPQGSDGVQLMTVHAAKGLEWRLVAVFDLGRHPPPQRDVLRMEAGRVHLPSGPGYAAAAREAAARDEDEGFRQLYVAASRARDALILSGSLRGDRVAGWARALDAMGLLRGARERDGRHVMLKRHAYRPAPPSVAWVGAEETPPEPAPWIDDRHPPAPHPPLQSPTSVRRVAWAEAAAPEPEVAEDGTGEESEPLPPGGAWRSDALPGRGAVVGTLVHHAIARGFSAEDPAHLEALRTQEMMFPFGAEEQEALLQEVAELLRGYAALVGAQLPAVEGRERDHAEWSVALPDGTRVWEGVIDRLYRVDGAWLLDDYKTDRTLHVRRYHFQLAVYREAVRRVLGVAPHARLVDLRHRRVIPLDDALLEAAWRERPAGA